MRQAEREAFVFADIAPIRIEEVRAAAARLSGLALRTPVVPIAGAEGGCAVHLKLEGLQPIGSFKVRPIGNAVLTRGREALADGIYTSSSGNSALAVAWMADRLGIVATALVPRGASEAKLAPIRALGAHVEILPPADWWEVIKQGGVPSLAGTYIDAVRDAASLAGDGTIGLELIEQLPEIDAIFVPFGGGGLASGIGCAVKALRPDIRIVVCELTTAQPLAAAFAAGGPTEVPADTGFVSGAGASTVLPEMWPLLRDIVDEVVTVSLAEVAGAVRLMAERNHVIAEGAGAIPVAAALSGRHRYRNVCAVVSGGNLELSRLAEILQGRVPA
jgi:threonine dehydratase